MDSTVAILFVVEIEALLDPVLHGEFPHDPLRLPDVRCVVGRQENGSRVPLDGRLLIVFGRAVEDGMGRCDARTETRVDSHGTDVARDAQT